MSQQVYFTLFALSAMTALCTNSQENSLLSGTRLVGSETRFLSPFNRIVVDGQVDLTIHQGDGSSLTMEGISAMFPRLYTRVEDGTLTMRYQQVSSLAVRLPISVHLTSREIGAIEVSNGGRVTAGSLKTAGLSISAFDTSLVHIRDLDATSVWANLDQTAKIELGGKAHRQMVRGYGQSSYYAPEMKSQQANLRLFENSQAMLWVTEALAGIVGGTTFIQYYGRPLRDLNLSPRAHTHHLGMHQ